ncbi:DUF2069 domain-containing protein [Proteobacteria bacterium 005FR1]|nr:DUF2069 domain-containing protein [Proteobacteria bacterium 005FR1]
MVARSAYPPKPNRLIWSERLTLGSLAGLVALFTWLNLTGEHGSIMRWLVQCLPLLMFVPGLLRENHRSYSWLCFVVLIYMVPAITQVVMSLGFRDAERPPGYWGDPLMLLLVVVLFFAATLSSRWLQYWRLEANTRIEDEQG